MLARSLRLAIACLVLACTLMALWLPARYASTLLATLTFMYLAWFALGFQRMAAVHAKAGAFPLRPATVVRCWWREVVAATRAFGLWQAFLSHSWANQIPRVDAGPSARRGVVLVHGFVCNRGVWMRWFSELRRRGIPYIAVDLEPVFGSIDGYSAIVGQAVSDMRACTGLAPLLVCHSMGGLAVRAWLRDASRFRQIHHVATIGTPHRGTCVGGKGVTWPPNAHQMQCSSPWLAELARGESPDCAKFFTCFYSDCDNVVMPRDCATLEGADNRLVSAIPHLAMVADQGVMEQVLGLL